MKRNKVRKYKDEDGTYTPFTVFISHGRSPLRNKVKKFIEEKLNFATEMLVDRYRGSIIYDKLEDSIWDSDCAVVIMTPDDEVKNLSRARQNVIHELGYLQGLYQDIELIIILKENKVEWLSNLNGIEYIKFDGNKISSTFSHLEEALEDIYKWYVYK